jgi:hypothetical protein
MWGPRKCGPFVFESPIDKLRAGNTMRNKIEQAHSKVMLYSEHSMVWNKINFEQLNLYDGSQTGIGQCVKSY